MRRAIAKRYAAWQWHTPTWTWSRLPRNERKSLTPSTRKRQQTRKFESPKPLLCSYYMIRICSSGNIAKTTFRQGSLDWGCIRKHLSKDSEWILRSGRLRVLNVSPDPLSSSLLRLLGSCLLVCDHGVFWVNETCKSVVVGRVAFPWRVRYENGGD